MESIFKKLKSFNTLQGYRIVYTDDNPDDDKDPEIVASSQTRCCHCPSRPMHTQSRYKSVCWFVSSGWALSICLLLFLVVLLWFSDQSLQHRCFRKTSSYSEWPSPLKQDKVDAYFNGKAPLLGEVPNTLQETRFNGSIRWPSPYRGPRSPDIDRAWDRISKFRPLNIKLQEDEFLRVGKDPDTAATNPPEFGGGYFLQPEFSHQLHCVNLLRKASYFKYSYYKTRDPNFRDKEATFKVHIDHCVEILRQLVMCHADIGVVTAHWIKQRDRPWPDFNTKHVCRDFEAIWQWTVDHQMPEGTPMIPLKPAGAKAMSSPP